MAVFSNDNYDEARRYKQATKKTMKENRKKIP